MLPLDVFVHQQPKLPLHVSVLQVYISADCAASGCVCPQAAYAASGFWKYLNVIQQHKLLLHVSVLLKTVLPLNVFVLQQPELLWTCVCSMAACAVPGRV
jgi:hypothetical protein